MAANVQVTTGLSPCLRPEAVSASHPDDVWFSYTFSNSGDTDDTTTGFYFVISDQSGTFGFSDYAPDGVIPAGGSLPQQCHIRSSVFESMQPGDYWISLRSPQGDTMTAALLTVAP